MQLNERGRLPNKISESDIDSADAAGWMFFRMRDILHLINASEKKVLVEELKKCI